MKKVMVFVAVLTMVAFVFGAMAAEKAKTAPAPAPKMQRFAGTIVKVDAVAKTFDVKKMVTVKEKEETVMTFATDELKKILKDKHLKSFADLKAGMYVHIEYKVEAGKNQAIAVGIHPAPKAAPAPKK